MDVRLRFPLRRRFRLEDHWPVAVADGELSFEMSGAEATALVVTFKDQPTLMAPALETMETGPARAEVTVRGGLEAHARRLVQRFVDFANLYFSVDVDMDGFDAEYLPVDEDERSRMGIYAFKVSRERPVLALPFDMLAQAMFAGETQEDPSFISRLFNLSREALLSEQYIESFRYAFLLFEALYGEGKFKTPQLIKALLASPFREMVAETLVTYAPGVERGREAARKLAEAHPTPEALVAHLVDRRGHYFHGNLARPQPWHPDRQDEARPLAEFCIELGSQVAHHYAGAMFGPEINARFLANARAFGAVMSVVVQFRHADRGGRLHSGQLRFEVPGRVATSTLAIRVHKHFLEWAEVEFSDGKLISAIAKDAEANTELFRSQYLMSEEATLSPPRGEPPARGG